MKPDSLVRLAPLILGWALMSPVIAVVVRRITRAAAPLPARLASHLAAASVFIAIGLALGSSPAQAGALYTIIALASLAFELHRRARHAAQLERQLFVIRLQCSAMKVHPHFLFNALHAISTLIDVRPHDARRMLARLSDLLRTAVEFMEASEVPLTRELEWIEQYVELQQIRHEERLEIDIEVAPEAVRAMVPPLVLQPLIENSIKHGVEKREGGGKIVIDAERAGGTLRLRVRDDGPGPAADLSRGGVGLSNTRARLETLYGTGSSVTLRAVDGGGAEAVVEIPFRERAA